MGRSHEHTAPRPDSDSGTNLAHELFPAGSRSCGTDGSCRLLCPLFHAHDAHALQISETSGGSNGPVPCSGPRPAGWRIIPRCCVDGPRKSVPCGCGPLQRTVSIRLHANLGFSRSPLMTHSGQYNACSTRCRSKPVGLSSGSSSPSNFFG